MEKVGAMSFDPREEELYEIIPFEYRGCIIESTIESDSGARFCNIMKSLCWHEKLEIWEDDIIDSINSVYLDGEVRIIDDKNVVRVIRSSRLREVVDQIIDIYESHLLEDFVL